MAGTGAMVAFAASITVVLPGFLRAATGADTSANPTIFDAIYT